MEPTRLISHTRTHTHAGGTPLDDAIRHKQEVTETMLRRAGGRTKDDPHLVQLKEIQDLAHAKEGKKMRKSKVITKADESTEAGCHDAFVELLSTFNPVAVLVVNDKQDLDEDVVHVRKSV